MVERAKSAFAKKTLIPMAIAKEPYKMLKSMYPEEYKEEQPTTAIQVNIDNRPLIAVPSQDLLQTLKELKEKSKQLPETIDATKPTE